MVEKVVPDKSHVYLGDDKLLFDNGGNKHHSKHSKSNKHTIPTLSTLCGSDIPLPVFKEKVYIRVILLLLSLYKV